MSLFLAIERLCATKANSPEFHDRMADVQAILGQHYGDIAGEYFEPSIFIEWDKGDFADRLTIVNSYISLEIQRLGQY